jgi:hypothetical protein
MSARLLYFFAARVSRLAGETDRGFAGDLLREAPRLTGDFAGLLDREASPFAGETALVGDAEPLAGLTLRLAGDVLRPRFAGETERALAFVFGAAFSAAFPFTT